MDGLPETPDSPVFLSSFGTSFPLFGYIYSLYAEGVELTFNVNLVQFHDLLHLGHPIIGHWPSWSSVALQLDSKAMG